MTQRDEKREDMVRYLLDLLPEGELQRFEASLFVDDRLFDELGAVEDELIDDYVNDQLSKQERQRVETHFLSSPQRRERVTFARALKIYVDNSQNTRSSGLVTRCRRLWRRFIGF